jgi:protein phosphatase
MKVAFAALTDVGLVRQNNEDTYLVLDLGARRRHIPPPASGEGRAETSVGGLLFAVADGMGGALAGEVAARMAVEALADAAPGLDAAPSDEAARDLLVESIRQANERIYGASQANPAHRGMGTTLTVALIRDGRVQFFQVGDSKGFIVRGGKLHQMTKAHSLIDQLVDDHVISPEDAEQLQGGKNIILRALGAEATVKVDYSEGPLAEGDTIVVCSDGLHSLIKNRELEELVAGSTDVGKLCEDLVREARDRGGPDNITVVGVSVLDAGEKPPPPGILDRLKTWFGGERPRGT